MRSGGALRGPASVVVSGGAGFIGSHTVERLVAEGCRVMVIDDMSHPCGASLPDSVELIEADCGLEEVAATVRRFRPEAALHLASKGGVARAGRDPGGHARASLASSVAFFHACAGAGALRIVTASSGGTVYGAAQRFPTPETARPAPLSAYGSAKLAEEVYLASVGRSQGLSTMALRYGNVYGPRQDGTGEAGVVAITSRRLAGNRPPLLFGDGMQTRDFIYVEDVAAANAAALTTRRSGPVNIASGEETSVSDLLRGLAALAHAKGAVERLPGRPHEVRRVCLDPGRAGRWLGWSPHTSLGRGLESTFRHFKVLEGTS